MRDTSLLAVISLFWTAALATGIWGIVRWALNQRDWQSDVVKTLTEDQPSVDAHTPTLRNR